jgi:4-hydroxybenzoyl-CoA thioesterase
VPYERDKLIRFHHCDPAGIVFYPQYFVLMNELVEDWFDEGLGHPFGTFHGIERLGLPMAHLECDFLVPSRVGDRLTFRLEVEKLGNASMTLAVTASRSGVVRIRARLVVVLAAMDTGKPVPIAGELRERFTRFLMPAPAGADPA